MRFSNLFSNRKNPYPWKNTFEIKPEVFHTKVISKEDGKIMDFVSFSMHFYMKRFSSVPQAKIYLKKFSYIVDN
jgi:hypothetical protein